VTKTSDCKTRPVEVMALLNPAFTAIMISSAVRGYCSLCPEGMPFISSFLVLPIVLHKPTRILLPKSMRTKMPAWLAQNAEVRVDFAKRMSRLAKFTKEGILFAGNGGLIKITASGLITPTTQKPRAPEWSKESESMNCLLQSAFVGKWLGMINNPLNSYVMWGIKP